MDLFDEAEESADSTGTASGVGIIGTLTTMGFFVEVVWWLIIPGIVVRPDGVELGRNCSTVSS
jgi:hypothetical protein